MNSIVRMISIAETKEVLEREYKINFRSSTFCQIYAILKHYGQQEFLRFSDQSSDLAHQFKLEAVKLFESCGIFFEKESSDKFTYYDVKNRKYLLILKKEDLVSVENLKTVIAVFCETYDVEPRNLFVVVEHFYESSVTAAEDAKVLREALPTNLVFNSFFEIKVDVKKYQLQGNSTKVEYYNVADLFRDLSVTTEDIDLDVRNAKRVLDRVIQKQHDFDNEQKQKEKQERKQLVFCCDFGQADGILKSEKSIQISAANSVVYSIAAYCAIEFGMKFELNPFEDRQVFYYYRKLLSRNFNYLSDYLNFVRNPIDCGFRLFDDRIYICCKNFEVLQKYPKKYQVSLQVRGIPFNLDTKSFTSRTTWVSDEWLSELQIVPLQEVFDLDTFDWNRAIENLKQLNKVMADAEKIFIREGIYREPLNVTNTIIVKKGGLTYFTWIDKVKGEVPYLSFLYPTGSVVFQDKLQLHDLVSLYDFKLVLDGRQLLAKFIKKGMVPRNNITYKLPQTASGIVVTDLVASATRASNECGIRVSELGIWYPVTTQFRDGENAQILKCFPNAMARQKFLLTCFGGPHNALGTTISLLNTIV